MTTGTRSTSASGRIPTRTRTTALDGSGLFDDLHQVVVLAYDHDENLFGGVGVPPGPSGQQPGTSTPNYVFLESQRIDLLGAVSAGAGWDPAQFKGGWVDATFHGPGFFGDDETDGVYNQAWVGVQHTAPGAFISVGHAASNLDNQFLCHPNRIDPGTVVDFTNLPVFGARASKSMK